MADTPRPTAEELEELSAIVRRDPGSPAFVDLAAALLSLGRAREAIEVTQAGLQLVPDNHEGRLVLARGHAALHQWREAQAELLKVVKVDRASKVGFVLLGEVLLRRADYERATPVLQHAQNLDPSNPAVLALLRAARNNQPLDPPAPIPTPIAPRRAEPRARPSASVPPPAPPRAAPPAPPPRPSPGYPGAPPAVAPAPGYPSGPAAFAPAPGYPSGPAAFAPAAPPSAGFVDDAPTTVGADLAGASASGPAIVASGFARGDETVPSLPPEHVVAPPAPPRKPPGPSVAPSLEGVRPRVLSTAKPVNAAAAALRQSAAVGETYLNDLLTGGLLDVPGVRVPDLDYDLRPDRRWGRSTVRAFIVLFVLLVAGVGGGGYWYYFTEKQRAADVAKLRAHAETVAAQGTFDGLTEAQADLAKALKRDGKNTQTFAAVAEVTALKALLYGTRPDGVDQALAAASRKITKPTQPGYRALVIARTAVALARLTGTGDDTPNEVTVDLLTKARAEIDAWIVDHPDDRWAAYLAAQGQLAAGARLAAATALGPIGEGDAGLVVADVARADLLADDGKYDEAVAIYDAALAKSPDHPLALLGRALARAESGADATTAIETMNVKLGKDMGARVDGYRELAVAMAFYNLEDPPRFAEALAKARGPREPRFLARVAMAHFLEGKLADAAGALSQVRWYTTGKPDPDPQVALVNGALQLAAGTPETALDTLSKLAGTRAEILRGQAYLDLGKPKDALTELDAAAELAPDSLEIKLWRLMALALSSTGSARAEAVAELEKTSRKFKSKLGRHVHGLTMLQLGDTDEAKRRLNQAVEDVSDAEPNPLAYRSRIGLATIERQAGRVDQALEQVDLALQANPGYLPARIEKARALVAAGKGDEATAVLEAVLAEPELVTGPVELLAAEALVARDLSKLRDKEKAALREQAKAALVRAQSKGVDGAELARVAELIEPGLAATMGAAPAEAPAPARKPPRRRRR